MKTFSTVIQTRDITSEDHLPSGSGVQVILTALQTRIADTVDTPLFFSSPPGRMHRRRPDTRDQPGKHARGRRPDLQYYNTDMTGASRSPRLLCAYLSFAYSRGLAWTSG